MALNNISNVHTYNILFSIEFLFLYESTTIHYIIKFYFFLRLNIYGLNEIKVPVQSIIALILLEVFNPFYIFQLFTIGVWVAERYYYYCIAVVLMSTFGVATSVIQTKKV